MKAKLNLPDENLSKENKELKKILKALYKTYKSQGKLMKSKDKLIKKQDNIINLLQKQKEVIGDELAKGSIHFHYLNDEKFKEYREKKYLR